MTNRQLRKLPSDDLTPKQLKTFPTKALSKLTPKQFKQLNIKQINALPDALLDRLNNRQRKALNRALRGANGSRRLTQNAQRRSIEPLAEPIVIQDTPDTWLSITTDQSTHQWDLQPINPLDPLALNKTNQSLPL